MRGSSMKHQVFGRRTGSRVSELSPHVTLVRDAPAAFSREAMRAAHDISGPTFAHAIVTTKELIAALPKA